MESESRLNGACDGHMTGQFGCHECRLLGCLVFPFLFLNLVNAGQGPFFPPEAMRHGLTPSVYSIVPAFYRAMILLSCPIVGLCASKMGTRKIFILGIFLNGIGPALFGLLHFANSPVVFMSVAVILRGVEGIGYCFIQIPGLMTINHAFPGKMSIAAACVFAGMMSGQTFGPGIAAVVFKIGGFSSTFFFLGILQLVCGVIVSKILPATGSDANDLPDTLQEALIGFKRFFKYPFIYIFMFGTACTQLGNGFFDAVLEPGLEQFHLSSLELGLTFGLLGIFQLPIPFWGFLLERMKHGQILLICGALLCIGGMGLVGPYPFLPLSPSYKLTAIGLSVYGIGKGLSQTSSYVMLKREMDANVGETRLGSSFVATGQVAGIGIGGAVGAWGSGILFDAYGFPVSTCLVFAAFSTLLILVLLFTCQQFPIIPEALLIGRFRRKGPESSIEVPPAESTPLLSQN